MRPYGVRARYPTWTGAWEEPLGGGYIDILSAAVDFIFFCECWFDGHKKAFH